MLNSGIQGETFTVGGMNPEQNWLVVGTSSSSAWLSRELARFDGDYAQ